MVLILTFINVLHLFWNMLSLFIIVYNLLLYTIFT